MICSMMREQGLRRVMLLAGNHTAGTWHRTQGGRVLDRHAPLKARIVLCLCHYRSFCASSDLFLAQATSPLRLQPFGFSHSGLF